MLTYWCHFIYLEQSSSPSLPLWLDKEKCTIHPTWTFFQFVPCVLVSIYTGLCTECVIYCPLIGGRGQRRRAVKDELNIRKNVNEISV